MNDRDAFLARVRAAAASARAQANSRIGEAPPPDQRLARLVDRSADLPTLFRERAVAAGAKVIEGPDWTASLVQALRDRSVRSVSLSIADAGLRAQIQGALTRAGVEMLSGEGRSHQFAADAGITDCQAAVAETGSIVLASSPDAPRLTAFIPGVHIALVSRERILPDLLDLFAAPRGMPAALTLISAPSKTADIEGILITGVHGPGELILLLL